MKENKENLEKIAKKPFWQKLKKHCFIFAGFFLLLSATFLPFGANKDSLVSILVKRSFRESGNPGILYIFAVYLATAVITLVAAWFDFPHKSFWLVLGLMAYGFSQGIGFLFLGGVLLSILYGGGWGALLAFLGYFLVYLGLVFYKAGKIQQRWGLKELRKYISFGLLAVALFIVGFIVGQLIYLFLFQVLDLLVFLFKLFKKLLQFLLSVGLG